MCALRCPPQCSSKCSGKHHPLLLALVNWPEGDSGKLDQAKAEFAAQMHKYEQSGSWSKEKDVPEENDLYKFPLLHWAAVLGKISAVKSLLDVGVSNGLQTRQYKESALHRAINCLQQTRPKDAFKVMQKLVPLLDATLMVRDVKGNTPLHLSCNHLDNEKPKMEFFTDVIALLASHTKDKGTASKVLNMKNVDGNTVLHILCRHDRNIPSIRQVVEAGAEMDVCNNEGLKPLDIAIESGQMKISKYLDSMSQLTYAAKVKASVLPQNPPATKKRKLDGSQKAVDSDSDGSSDKSKSNRGRKPKNNSSANSSPSATTSKRNSQSSKNSAASKHKSSTDSENKVNGDKPQQVKDKITQGETDASDVKDIKGTVPANSSTTTTTSSTSLTPSQAGSTPTTTTAVVNGVHDSDSVDDHKRPESGRETPEQSMSNMSFEGSPPAGWSVLLRYLSNFEGSAKKAIMDALVEDEKDCLDTVKSKERQLTDFTTEVERREDERKAKEQLLIQRLNEIMVIQNEVKQMEVRSSQDQQTMKELQTSLANLKEKQDSCVAALQATNTMFSTKLTTGSP